MIAECTNLIQAQVFDVIGLVTKIGTARPVNTTSHAVFDIEIIDGSMTDNQARTMPRTVWTDSSGTLEPPQWVFLDAAFKEKAPVAFFRAKGARDYDEKFSFVTTRNTLIAEATC